MNLRMIATVAFLMACQPVLAGDWQLGLVAQSRETGIPDRQDEQTLLPAVNYEGDRFSFVGGVLSYTLHQSAGTRISLLGQGRDEGYKAKDSRILAGMQHRKFGFDLGLGAILDAPAGKVHVKLLADITGRNDGLEIDAGYHYPLQAGRWSVEPVLGVSWKSAELVDYYYGVRHSEARPGRSAYRGGAAINPYARMNLAYSLNRNWLLIGGFDITLLDDTVADSPIIDRDYQLGVFGAVLYAF